MRICIRQASFYWKEHDLFGKLPPEWTCGRLCRADYSPSKAGEEQNRPSIYEKNFGGCYAHIAIMLGSIIA